MPPPSELLERLSFQIVPLLAHASRKDAKVCIAGRDTFLNGNGIRLPQRTRLSGILIRFPRVAPLVAFGLALAATLLVVISIEHSSRIEQRTEVTERVTALTQDLERRVSATQAYLMSGAALFESGMDVDQATFNRFAATLQADNDFQGIMALGWSVRMRPDQVAAFEAMMRQSGFPDYRAWPQQSDPQTGFVDAIKYIAPINADNRNTIGFNLRSEPARRAAVDRAAESRRPTITGRVRRLQGGDVPGIIMIAPVYEYGGPSSTRGQLKGFITGGMRADRFILASIIGQADSKLDLEVYDQQIDPAHLLFRQGGPIASGTSIIRYAHVADRVWVVKSSIAPLGLLGQTGMLVLLAGLIIASLLLFIVRLAIQQALFDRRQLEARQEQDAIRAKLTREPNHRVKNTLANVLSILSLSRRNAQDLDTFVSDFEARVRALSATYNLLLHTSWGATSVRSVLEAEMAPYFESDPPRISLEGHDTQIAPNDALSLGLLIHELVTNAAKFGALSNATGRVELRWTQSGGDRLLFDWQESGGPPPPDTRQRGFGSELIEKVISRELRTDIRLEFPTEGLHVGFAVPIRQAVAFSLSQARPET
jgi:two-component sensor histidine kinase/sensor domain CHASE-containing protein